MLEVGKAVLFVLASAIMGVAVLAAPEICGTVAPFFVGILAVYLGVDIWSMILKTKTMPRGEYANVKMNRYVIVLVCYAVLICLGYYVKKVFGVNMDSMFSAFVAALFIILGLLMGSLEANKVATIQKNTEIDEAGEPCDNVAGGE